MAQASDDLVFGVCGAARPAIKSIRQFPDKLCLTTSKCQDPHSKQSGKHFMARCVHEPECDMAALSLPHHPAWQLVTVMAEEGLCSITSDLDSPAVQCFHMVRVGMMCFLSSWLAHLLLRSLSQRGFSYAIPSLGFCLH